MRKYFFLSAFVPLFVNAAVLSDQECVKGKTCAWNEINQISASGTSVFNWTFYNKGGEGYAYHDNNSGAYKTDKDGNVIGYNAQSDEVDVFSQAYKLQFLNEKCPWSVVEDGKVISFEDIIKTSWTDPDDETISTYKSLNGGRAYHGDSPFIRPDEGVDLLIASCRGTEYQDKNYSSIGWVEEGEWIRYTVDVEKAGFYKISGVVSSEYNNPSRYGEISIVDTNGKNLLRSKSDLGDSSKVNTFGFNVTNDCFDGVVYEPWNCWSVSDAHRGKEKEIVCYFENPGVQEIIISFSDDAGGVGPLLFSYAADPLESIGTCEKKPFGPYHTINTISKDAPSLFQWNYFNEGGAMKAYFDMNTSAYNRDEDGVIIGYNNKSDEVDVFSSALEKEMLYGERCPWAKIKNCDVIDFDASIASSWEDKEGNRTYKSLNGGRNYCGNDEKIRPDEEVDLFLAQFKGTPYDSLTGVMLGYVEANEWITYTVDVKDPGYYMIKGLVSSQYFAPEKNGEISISSKGNNLLRSVYDTSDEDAVYSFGFPLTIKCADEEIEWQFTWDCWQLSNAKNADENVVYCKFEKSGLQEITVLFHGDAGGVGPLVFEYAADIEPKINKITPNEPSVFHWENYRDGGEGIAYHDINSGAYLRDEDGVVLDYNNEWDEVDVYSLAQKMQWLDKPCPWTVVENGRVTSFDESISSSWEDEYGNSTYRSLNAGRMYCGYNDIIRPDEGVDLAIANCKGTPFENKNCTNTGWVEEGEWISYTVNVEKAGYYTISAIVSSEYMGVERNGEISITSSDGNLLRPASKLWDSESVTTFGFPVTTKCADETIETYETWNCWNISNARTSRVRGENVVCLFPKEGEQTITISFVESAGGIGPMFFTFAEEYTSEYASVDKVSARASEFTITPNPTSGEFTVALSEAAEATVEIVNMAGQVLVSQVFENTVEINEILPAGVYTVVVKSSKGVNTQKLIVR